jgi:hypothetical protein
VAVSWRSAQFRPALFSTNKAKQYVLILFYQNKSSCLIPLFDIQVFIHNPAARGAGRLSSGRVELGTNGDVSLLNVNQVISSVAAGRLDPRSTHDTLVVGTQTNLLGYDVMNNSDIFYKDVSITAFKWFAVLVVYFSMVCIMYDMVDMV